MKRIIKLFFHNMGLLTMLFLAISIFLTARTAVYALPPGSSLVFDRGLPTMNLNIAAGVNRSNVDWGHTNLNKFHGDDFQIGSLGEQWIVDRIRLWSIMGAVDDPSYYLGNDYQGVTLYGSSVSTPIQLLASGTLTFGSNINSNSNITHTKVTYTDGSSLQYGDGSYHTIWQTDYDNLNWAIQGGQLYQFGQHGETSAILWYNHASNALLSGSTQMGTDDKIRIFKVTDLSYLEILDTITIPNWNKSTDINVQIWAHKDTSSYNGGCKITKTGPGSRNICIINNSKKITVNNNQNANIRNNVRARANTGNNIVAGNSISNSIIQTGDAQSTVRINNTINQSIIEINQ